MRNRPRASRGDFHPAGSAQLLLTGFIDEAGRMVAFHVAVFQRSPPLAEGDRALKLA